MGNPTNPNRVVRVKDLDRFKSNTDGLYATNENLGNKADKSTTYTKIEVDAKIDALVGPTYDSINRGIILPSTSKATYADNGITFT